MWVVVRGRLIQVLVQRRLVGGPPRRSALGVESEDFWDTANRLHSEVANAIRTVLLPLRASRARRVRPALRPDVVWKRAGGRRGIDATSTAQPLQPAILEKQRVPATCAERLAISKDSCSW